MSVYWNGSALNSLMWNGLETTGIYNSEVVCGSSYPSFKTLTLYHSDDGWSATGYAP